jgi:SAM-dependent methyltransferase
MTQLSGGLRGVLSIPSVYSWFRRLVIADEKQAEYVQTYVVPQPGERILDVGCGPADVLAHFPEGVAYEGFDLSEEYVEQARRRWGDRGAFHCASVADESLAAPDSFDAVLAIGVLHHLSDEEALSLFRLAHRALKPGGRLVTTDGCYEPGQSFWARYFLSHDRGRNVRDQHGYLDIARQVFDDVTVHVRRDLLRIPYTHLILQCRKPVGPS